MIRWLLDLFRGASGPNALLLLPPLRTAWTDWAGGTSWLGGRPRLGEADWPRNPHDNEPLHLVAQIDCAAVSQAGFSGRLPSSGALAFFVESDLNRKIRNEPAPRVTGKVIHIPDPGDETDPPPDTPPLYGADWSYYARWARDEAEAPRLFTRHPLDLVPARLKAQTLEDDYWQAARGHLRGDLADMPVPPRTTLNWRAVGMMVHDFARCSASKAEFAQERMSDPDRAETAREEYAFATGPERSFVEAWQARIAAQDPHAPLSIDDLAAFDLDLFALTQAMREFEGDFSKRARASHGRYINSSIDPTKPHLEDYLNFKGPIRDTFLQMAAQDDAAYRAVPEDLRAFLGTPMAEKPRNMWLKLSHMFGAPTDVQGANDGFGDDVLLLQSASDGPFMWGDVGYIKYWIKPDDLKAARFDAAVATFEGH